jgi:hypothetical protein
MSIQAVIDANAASANTPRMKRACTVFALFLLIDVVGPYALGLGFLDESLLAPTGMVGKPYSHRLNGRAGSPPYHFKIDSGKLPPGIALSTNGLISGIPSIRSGRSRSPSLTSTRRKLRRQSRSPDGN